MGCEALIIGWNTWKSENEECANCLDKHGKLRVVENRNNVNNFVRISEECAWIVFQVF